MDDFAMWDEVLDGPTLAGLADGSIRPLDTAPVATPGALIYGK